jgi:hypothetical protein
VGELDVREKSQIKHLNLVIYMISEVGKTETSDE